MNLFGSCAPRAKNAVATRAAIFDSARRRFLAESYDNVGMRDVAGDAGVDVALVSRYFGSKEALFKEVLRGCEESKLPPGLESKDLPAYLATMLVHQDREENRGHVERLLMILRSASSPRAAEIVREALREDVMQPFADMLEGDHAPARASLVMAIWMGTTILRTIMAVESPCPENREFINRRLVSLFEAALSKDEASA